MKKVLIGIIALGSISSYAQVVTYNYPRIADESRGVNAYISAKSSLDHVCRVLSGGSEGTYAISRETEKRDTRSSELRGYRNLIRIEDYLSTARYFLKEESKVKLKDKIISKLECQVLGVWRTVIIDNSDTNKKMENSGQRNFQTADSDRIRFKCNGETVYMNDQSVFSTESNYPQYRAPDCSEYSNELNSVISDLELTSKREIKYFNCTGSGINYYVNIHTIKGSRSVFLVKEDWGRESSDCQNYANALNNAL